MKKKLSLLIVAIFVSFTTMQAQNWSQIGADIDGEAASDYSGKSVSLSADGSIMAIGVENNDGNGADAGHVRVYQNILGTWTQIGADIDGEAAGDASGFSVSLNANGTIVAIGAIGNNGGGNYAGHVRVYQNQSGTWTQIGADIDGQATYDFSGWSVSLNASGTIVAIGATILHGGLPSYVRVFENQAGIWTQIGANIVAGAEIYKFGYSVSLSSDGSIVAIGAIKNLASPTDVGHVWVYQNILGTWTQIGAAIEGEAARDYSGCSISLSSDGSILAIGADGNDGNGEVAGHVRVYQNILGTWTQIGADIDGEGPYDYSGASVSLSADGFVVAIGAVGGLASPTDAGHVRVYQNILGTWTQLGTDIDGEAAGDQLGQSVSLSADGTKLAIGAPGNDDNGIDAGSVRAYELIQPPLITIQPVNQSNMCVNAAIYFTVAGNNINSYQWQVDDGSGFVNITNGSVYSNATTATLNITGVTYAINNYQYRCIVTNQGGDIPSNSAVLTFEDIVPVITSTHSDQIVNAENNCQAALLDYTNTVIATDNCDVNLIITQSPISGTLISGTTNTVTLTATDDAENFAEVSFNVLVEDNSSPVITSIHNEQIVDLDNNCEATLLDYTNTVTATDNCDAILDITQSPISGISISGATNQVTLTATDDDGNYSEVSFNVLVEDNTNPVIICVGNNTVNADATHFYIVNGTVFNPILTSDNCQVASVTNNINGTASLAGASFAEGETHTVIWTITDVAGNENTCSFDITVSQATNTAPEITSTAPTTATVGQEYTYEVIATDAEFDDLTYSLSNAPAGMTITNNIITWTPTQGITNSGIVTVTVSDGQLNDFESFIVYVTAITNTAPEITSTAPTTATVGQEYTYEVIATDAELDDLTYSLSNQPAGMIITDNLITWTPAQGTINSGIVTLTVSDGQLNDFENFMIFVSAIANTAPEITSTAPTTASVGQEYNYEVIATDAEFDDLTYSLSNAPAGMTITNNIITWTPTQGITNSGIVTVTVSDGQLNDFESFIVYVTAITNTAPEITSTAPTTATVGQEYTYEVIATDAEFDVLTYSLSNAPAGMTITNNIITWTPTQGTTNSGIVTVTVSDGQLNDFENFIVYVTAITNTAPEITSTAPTTASVGQEYTYEVIATDAEFDDLTYSLSNAPAGMTITNNIITWTPTQGITNSGIVTVTVSDGQLNDFESFIVYVTAITNTAPEITSTAPTTASVGQEYTYEVIATDAEFDVLTYSLSNQPAGMIITDNLITWTPAQGTINSGIVTLTVSDGQLNDFESFIVYVTAITNTAPEITSTAPTTASVGQEYTYEVIATDAEFDVLTYSLSNQPAGMIITDNLITWTPAQGTINSGIVTLTVSDGQLNDFENFIVYVTAVGILDLQQIGISIYPNPTTGLINIKDDELKITNIQITDNLGQAIQSFSNSQTIDISHLQNGIYLIRIQTKNNVYIEKIIKF